MPPKPRSAFERVCARFDEMPVDSCWIWPGALYRNGYGHVGGPGRQGGDLLVHVVTYESLVGPVPEGCELDHLCPSRACCNPYTCLEPVSHVVNVHRGRATKLTLRDVVEIHVRRREGQLQREIAEAFGLATGTVSLILSGKRWPNYHKQKGAPE